MEQQTANGEGDERTKEQFRLPIFEAEPESTDEKTAADAGENEKENNKSMDTIRALYDKLFARKAGK
jgi:hypothetical protein